MEHITCKKAQRKRISPSQIQMQDLFSVAVIFQPVTSLCNFLKLKFKTNSHAATFTLPVCIPCQITGPLTD